MPRDPQDPGPQRTITLKSLVVDGVICASVLSSFFLYRKYLRRIPNAESVPNKFLRRKTILGKVVSVGDADNFRVYHTPGGYLAGWGWLRKVPDTNERGLKDETIHVRLCGVDAPEAAHFGKPAQPYSDDALKWLRQYVLGRRVRVVPLAKDQYQRLVGEARVWKLTGRKNVSEEMLREGWGVVYEGKTGAEFNGMETKFRLLEDRAKRRRLGIFQKGRKIETPGEYKKKHKD